jgi:hypothetical protein
MLGLERTWSQVQLSALVSLIYICSASAGSIGISLSYADIKDLNFLTSEQQEALSLLCDTDSNRVLSFDELNRCLSNVFASPSKELSYEQCIAFVNGSFALKEHICITSSYNSASGNVMVDEFRAVGLPLLRHLAALVESAVAISLHDDKFQKQNALQSAGNRAPSSAAPTAAATTTKEGASAAAEEEGASAAAAKEGASAAATMVLSKTKALLFNPAHNATSFAYCFALVVFSVFIGAVFFVAPLHHLIARNISGNVILDKLFPTREHLDADARNFAQSNDPVTELYHVHAQHNSSAAHQLPTFYSQVADQSIQGQIDLRQARCTAWKYALLSRFYQEQNVPKDGNCLYHALLAALQNVGLAMDHDFFSLKISILSFMKENMHAKDKFYEDIGGGYCCSTLAERFRINNPRSGKSFSDYLQVTRARLFFFPEF